MIGALLLAAAGCAGLAACACLALALPDHWTQAGGHPADAARFRPRLRATGMALILLAWMLCTGRDGIAFGSLLWGMLMPAGALAVALILAWRPRCLLPVRLRRGVA
jgi:hypothetical protein